MAVCKWKGVFPTAVENVKKNTLDDLNVIEYPLLNLRECILSAKSDPLGLC